MREGKGRKLNIYFAKSGLKMKSECDDVWARRQSVAMRAAAGLQLPRGPPGGGGGLAGLFGGGGPRRGGGGGLAFPRGPPPSTVAAKAVPVVSGSLEASFKIVNMKTTPSKSSNSSE